MSCARDDRVATGTGTGTGRGCCGERVQVVGGAEEVAAGAADLRGQRPLGDVRILLGVAPAAGPAPVHEGMLR